MSEAKILIIDDESADRKSIERLLVREGFSPLAFAVSGVDGLEQARVFHPVIVIVDVVLPDMDGFDVCAALKKEFAGQVSVIMLTGHLDAVNVQKARNSGAQEILEKKNGFPGLVKIIASLSQR